jgi:hydrogenase-4 component F
MLLALVLLPVIPGLVVAVLGWRPWVAWFAVADAAALLAGGLWLATRVVDGGTASFGGPVLRADALSAFMVLVIAIVDLLASWSAVGYMRSELAGGRTTLGAARLFGLLLPAFVASMVLAVLAANLGIMWVAVEATTIASAFLVAFHRSRASLEASWKYVIIGSVGIVLAFLGTVLLAYATQHAGSGSTSTLDWEAMRSVARDLDPAVIRVAAVLLLLGYGTKIGLAPVHTWLPDAHSQAPAPISALMSGVLLSVAFYALLRVKVVIDLALGPAFLRNLLVVAALLSLVVAASLLIAQRDYKRLLAYSSIEHMGLVALAAAIGTPLAIAALLLHILAHALGKTVAFLCSGEILIAEGTTHISGVRGLLARRPLLGGSFGLALLALLGFPPFGLFASELAIARAGFSADMGWVTAAGFAILLVVVAAVLVHMRSMLLGAAPRAADPAASSRPAAVPLVAGLLLLAAIGITIWPIERLVDAAARVIVQ